MSNCPVIETERLRLRPFVESDLDAYTAAMTAPEVRHALFSPDDLDEFGCWTQMLTRDEWIAAQATMVNR